MKATWSPLLAAAIGFVVATAAGLVSLRAGAPGVGIVQAQFVGLAYLVAGGIAWRRRPDNWVGPLLVAIGCCWYIPDFQAVPVPAVAALAVGSALAIQRRLRDHAWPDEATVRVQRIEARLPPGASTHRLGAFGHKGLPGLEAISQLTVPDLPSAFPPLRLETPAQ